MCIYRLLSSEASVRVYLKPFAPRLRFVQGVDRRLPVLPQASQNSQFEMAGVKGSSGLSLGGALHIHTQIYVYIHIFKCANVFVYMCMYIHIYTCTYIYV